MKQRSLKLRLLGLQAVVIIIVLAITGSGLISLFERHIERRLGSELDTYLMQIISRLNFDEKGKAVLEGALADPRFETIYGGLYWQIVNETSGKTIRSRSLWDIVLDLPQDKPNLGALHSHVIKSPMHPRLLIHERRVAFRSSSNEQIVRIAVGLDMGELKKLAEAFTLDVVLALVALALFLLLAAGLQISFGLRPLAVVQKSIARVRSGKASRLTEKLPQEVAPLGHELNKLLDEQEKAMEKARFRANDLAHGFKTPLTALKTDIKRLRQTGQTLIADDIEAVSRSMLRQIEKELANARLRSKTAMPATDPCLLLPPIIKTLKRTPKGADMQIQIICDQKLAVRAQAEDLQDIFGNLLENAVKYANKDISVTITKADENVIFEISDDGPGITEKKRQSVLVRGVRLDQTVSGSGLGLSIVTDLLEIYDTSLKLSKSDLGGLLARFKLPIAKP